jgi:hypothetical protein
MRAFEWSKTIESVKLSSISWFLAIQENVEKSMPKWLPKSMKIDLKSSLGRTGCDCDSFLVDFGPC